MHIGEVRQALRALARRPAFAITAILTVALGIGANAAVYRVIYSVLIRPLPFREPARLMQLWETTPILPQLPVSVPDFQDWRAQTRSFSDVAAYTFQAMNHVTLLGQGEPEMVSVTNATANLFPAMGIQPLAGRAFTAADERAKSAVGLISEKLWRRKFNADPAIRGKLMRLETISFTIIGVLPDRQAFPA